LLGAAPGGHAEVETSRERLPFLMTPARLAWIVRTRKFA
jgi:hypothetical protein